MRCLVWPLLFDSADHAHDWNLIYDCFLALGDPEKQLCSECDLCDECTWWKDECKRVQRSHKPGDFLLLSTLTTALSFVSVMKINMRDRERERVNVNGSQSDARKKG